MKIFTFLLFFVFLTSCGNQSETNQTKENDHLETNTQSKKEIYKAKLLPINPLISGFHEGEATIMIYKNSFQADVHMTGTSPDTVHSQHIYLGNHCPDLSSDINNDGFIDIMEAYPKISKIMIPLDGNLVTQLADYGIFPLSNSLGNYSYSKKTDFIKLLHDLYQEDEFDDDDMIKLSADEPFDIEGKVIVVHSVSDTIDLPETVDSNALLSSHQSLPVACGFFEKQL